MINNTNSTLNFFYFITKVVILEEKLPMEECKSEIDLIEFKYLLKNINI